jgi:DNA-binding IclR family transcriptional regulator
MLAFLPAEQREEILPTLTFTPLTPRTIPNLARLRRELTRTAQQGFAIDDQEADMGARCVAAPILDERGKIAGAISVSGPTTRISKEKVQIYALAVKKGARMISARLDQMR